MMSNGTEEQNEITEDLPQQEISTPDNEIVEHKTRFKVDILYCGLPVFTATPTHTGFEGEVIWVNDSTHYYLYAYINGGWRYLASTDLTDSGATTAHKHDHGALDGLGDADHNDSYYTESELNAGQLDNQYYTETELNAGQLDTRYYTETEIDALSFGSAVYGDASDGDVDINSGTFTSGPIGSNSLTRDAYFDDLTLSGGNLDLNGWRLFVKGTLQIDAAYKILRNGKNGSAGASSGGGGGAGGVAVQTNTVYGSLVGKAGGNGASGGNGGAGTAGDAIANSIGGNGTAAGAGGDTNQGETGGAAGAGGVATATTNKPRSLIFGQLMDIKDGANPVFMKGGAGGGSGGGGGGQAGASGNGGGGGGSGSAGGLAFIACKILTLAGQIQANGGNGGGGGDGFGTEGSQAGGGGGSGGHGGYIIIIYDTKTGAGSLTATGGDAGSGGALYGSADAGAAGAAGTAGEAIEIVNK